jgi:hypothetical protein
LFVTEEQPSLAERDIAKIAKLLLEGGETLPEANGESLSERAPTATATTRRRGLPMIGRGVTGATTDTHPVRALLAKERNGNGNGRR